MLGWTHIDELFQIIIQVGKIVFPPLVIRDELLFPLQQLLTLLLQALSYRSLVVDPGKHEVVLVIVGMLGELLEEVFDRDEGELLVLVAGQMCQ
jgi:hypothetical protein